MVPQRNSRRGFLAVLHAIYLASGAAALLYEITWARLLTLDLGHTVASASAVLAAFMAGLAIGAALAGRAAEGMTARRALRAYAVLELATGMYALVLPFLLAGARPLFALAYGEHGGAWFAMLRVVVALLLVGIPATWMGATFPLILRAAQLGPFGGHAEVSANAQPHAASLYAANTLGAAAGALATGFALLPAMGMLRTSLVGAAANGILATAAWRWSMRVEGDALPPQSRRRERRCESAAGPLTMPALAVALSGATALALEIAWTRVLAMVVGPTTYAFSAMLTSFILALAVGAGLATWVARRTTHAGTWLAAALAGSGLAVVAGAAQVDAVVVGVARVAAQPTTSLGSMIAAQLWTAFVLLGPIALCSGAVFPLALRLADAHDSAHRAGFLYAANTTGAIAGALIAGFALIPLWGLQGTLRAAVAASALAATTLAAATAKRSLGAAAAVGLVAAVAVVASFRVHWDQKLLSAGGYKYAAYLGDGDLDALLAAGRLEYYAEGAASTVAVRDLAGVRSLSIDGKVDASTGGDMLTQRLLAHVPLLLHGSAARVAIVGLGSGVTAASALTHGISHVDVVEISRQVVEAASRFERENGRALDDRRVQLIVGDARTHFRLGRARYDVIVSEPSNPWMAGVAALFTREFFESLRASVSQGGIVCQWTQTYDLTPQDLRSIVATFIAVFPQATLWLIGDGDLLLVGSTAVIDAGVERLRAGFDRAEAARDLASVGVTGPAVLASLIVAGPDEAARWSAGAAIQRDDRMALEFSAPAETIGRSPHDNAADLRRAGRIGNGRGVGGGAATSDLSMLRDVGLMQLRAGAVHAAWDWLSSAGDTLSGDPVALRALARAAASTGRTSEAVAMLEALSRRHPRDVATQVELSRLLFASGRAEAALSVARAVVPIDAMAAAEQEASIAADLQNVDLLSSAVQELERLAPAAVSTAYYRATRALLTGNSEAAVGDALQVTRRNTDDARGWNLLGAALDAAQAPHDRIRDAFARAIQADPRDPTGYVNLATLELQAANPVAARERFAEALVLDPVNAPAREGLRAARLAERNERLSSR